MNDQTPGRAERGEMPLPAGYAPGAREEAPSGPEGTQTAPPPADTAAPPADTAAPTEGAAAAEPPTPAEDEPPREVVEYYPPVRPPKEVVLTYVQTRRLPGRPEHRRQEPGVQPANWSLDPPKPEKQKTRRGLWAFAACFAAALVLALGAFYLGGGFAPAEDPSAAPEENRSDWDTEPVPIPVYPHGKGARMEVAVGHGAELTVQEVYRLVNPAVVTVVAQLDRAASVGTGVIFRSDGYILTNYHVVAGSSACSIGLASGGTYEAKYVGGDSANDVAVLKVEADGLPAAQMGDSDALSVGDTVYAIGNPLGVELRGTLTDGIVSAINRDVEVQGRTMTLLQTNAALNEGNSGGPLIDVYGQVVGINTIKMMSLTSNIEGLGFALPMQSVSKLVNDILEYGEIQPEPRLGVTVYDLPTALPDGNSGVEVQSVSAGSAADRAGVKAGDVIVSAGGQSVEGGRHALLSVRRQYRVGDDLPMRIWRDGEYLDVTLHLHEAFTE